MSFFGWFWNWNYWPGLFFSRGPDEVTRSRRRLRRLGLIQARAYQRRLQRRPLRVNRRGWFGIRRKSN